MGIGYSESPDIRANRLLMFPFKVLSAARHAVVNSDKGLTYAIKLEALYHYQHDPLWQREFLFRLLPD